jgi:hypothetical protein
MWGWPGSEFTYLRIKFTLGDSSRVSIEDIFYVVSPWGSRLPKFQGALFYLITTENNAKYISPKQDELEGIEKVLWH